MRSFAAADQRASAHERLIMPKRNQRKKRGKPRKLRLKDIEKVMSKAEMGAYASACRIENGTAAPEDYKIVRRFEEALAASQVRASPRGAPAETKKEGV